MRLHELDKGWSAGNSTSGSSGPARAGAVVAKAAMTRPRIVVARHCLISAAQLGMACESLRAATAARARGRIVPGEATNEPRLPAAMFDVRTGFESSSMSECPRSLARSLARGALVRGPERSPKSTARESASKANPMKSRGWLCGSGVPRWNPAGARPRSRSDPGPPAGTRQNRAGFANECPAVSERGPQSGRSRRHLGGTTPVPGVRARAVTVKVTAPRADISAASRRNCACVRSAGAG